MCVGVETCSKAQQTHCACPTQRSADWRDGGWVWAVAAGSCRDYSNVCTNQPDCVKHILESDERGWSANGRGHLLSSPWPIVINGCPR